MQKVKILIVFFSFAILLLISFQHISLAYAESGCEQADWGLPLEGTPTVNSPFNSTSHFGADYKAADGDNVLAVADGVVLKNGVNLKKLNRPDPRSALMIKGWGRYVVLGHNDGSTTLYAHLIDNSTAHLKEGDPVTRGTIIGKADSTGGVTGSHLHLEYTSDGMWWRKLSRKDPHPCILGCKPEDILIIIGSETTTKNNTKPYTAAGCGQVEWSISPLNKGATITPDGLLTTTGTACGSFAITASCPSCSTTATKSVRVTDAGQWVQVIPGGCSPLCDYPRGGIQGCTIYSPYSPGSYEWVIEGQFMYYIHHVCACKTTVAPYVYGGTFYQNCSPSGVNHLSCPPPGYPECMWPAEQIYWKWEWRCQ